MIAMPSPIYFFMADNHYVNFNYKCHKLSIQGQIIEADRKFEHPADRQGCRNQWVHGEAQYSDQRPGK